MKTASNWMRMRHEENMTGQVTWQKFQSPIFQIDPEFRIRSNINDCVGDNMREA